MIEHKRWQDPMASSLWCSAADWAGSRSRVSGIWAGTFAVEEADADWCIGKKWEGCKNPKEYLKDFSAVQYHWVQIARWQTEYWWFLQNIRICLSL